MNRIHGQSQHQTEIGCLEDVISSENPVRVLVAFADKLDLNQLGKV
jgi:hypothetical protein